MTQVTKYPTKIQQNLPVPSLREGLAWERPGFQGKINDVLIQVL